jgi:hypothetical protein
VPVTDIWTKLLALYAVNPACAPLPVLAFLIWMIAPKLASCRMSMSSIGVIPMPICAPAGRMITDGRLIVATPVVPVVTLIWFAVPATAATP